MVVKESHLVFHVVGDEGGDHGNQAAGEDENRSTTQALVNFCENVALDSEHQSDEGNDFDHVIEMFFVGEGKRCGLTHAFLSVALSKT